MCNVISAYVGARNSATAGNTKEALWKSLTARAGLAFANSARLIDRVRAIRIGLVKTRASCPLRGAALFSFFFSLRPFRHSLLCLRVFGIHKKSNSPARTHAIFMRAYRNGAEQTRCPPRRPASARADCQCAPSFERTVVAPAAVVTRRCGPNVYSRVVHL